MIGAGFFAVFSLAAGLMPSVVPLIVCRGLMGIGGALMWPAILGMTYALLPEEKAGLAGGLILGVAGLGNAVGPLLGGFLTDELSWRWVFFINLPVTAFAVLVTYRVVHESTVDATERHIDYAGVAVLSIGIISILLALDEGPDDGFGDPAILGLFALGAVLLGSFLVVERRQGEGALVPNDVLRNRVFTGACGAVLLMSAIFFSALLYLPQFFEKVLDYSALESGAGLLPLMLVFAVSSFVAGPLYGRLGPRLVVVREERRVSRSASSGSRCSTPTRRTRRSCPAWSCSASASGSSTRRSPRSRSRRSTRRSRAWPAGSSTCARSPAARSASVSTPRSSRRRRAWPTASASRSRSTPGSRSRASLLVLAVIGRHEEATPRASLRTHHRAHA